MHTATAVRSPVGHLPGGPRDVEAQSNSSTSRPISLPAQTVANQASPDGPRSAAAAPDGEVIADALYLRRRPGQIDPEPAVWEDRRDRDQSARTQMTAPSTSR